MKKIAILGLIGILLFPSNCKAFSEKAKEDKPHIIVFISDDHGYEDSGVYGNVVIKTPNIDRLAKSGLTFTHAFAASPLCSPSRSVIETGLMPFRNGAHKFGTPIRENIRTMPEYFKELGYYTAEIGKFHHFPRARFPYDSVNGNENVAEHFIRAIRMTGHFSWLYVPILPIPPG